MFTKNDVDSIVASLKRESCVFVSEAHLQLAFALKINHGKYDVYPEYPATVNGKQSEFDLLVSDKTTGERTLVEFKYKTTNNTNNPDSFPISSGVTVILKDQSAIDNGWYDSWKDISRIEQSVLNNSCSKGFFILITNDKGYWQMNASNSKNAVSGLYMNDGHHAAGVKKFSNVKEYRGSRNSPITTLNDYDFSYQPFLDFPGKKYGEFKILVVEI